MKKSIIVMLLVFSNWLYAQKISGVIQDSISHNPIAFSNIVLMKGAGVYADKNGKFIMESKNSWNDTLKISAIGFISKKIPLLKYENINDIKINIFLSPRIEQLDEVKIKKISYTDKETLGERREGNIGVTSLIGYENCILIENPRKEIGKIKRVFLDLKKRKDADYIATFNIKFYEYDSINRLPGKEIYNKNIFVTPKNKNYRLWINVENLNIEFLENGVCVGVEMVNTIGEVKKYAYFGPMFRYTINKNNKSLNWSNYHNKGWQGSSNKHKKFKKFKTGTSNPMIGLEVLYPSY